MDKFYLFHQKIRSFRFALLLVALTGISIKASAQYCSTPILDCTDDDMVQSLTFAGITDLPICNSSSGYQNYTTSVTTRTLYKGSSYPLDAQVGYSDDEVGVWIDYNHDNTFSASEFTYIGVASSAGDILSGTVVVPTTAMTGNTRMRVTTYWLWGLYDTDACLPFASLGDYGDVDDYTVNIQPPPPPSCITAPTSPANAATAVCAGSRALTWPAAPGATGYDVYLNTGTGTPTTIVSTNQAGTNYTATLAVGPYTWMVVPKNSVGTATGCTSWSFTVIPTVTPSVTIAATPGNNICTGDNVSFTATPTNGGAAPSYQWKRLATTVATGGPTFTPTSVANGDKYSVVLTSNAVCATPASISSDTITMTVVPHPTATVTTTATSACQGTPANLQANTGTGLTYQWLLNNNVIPAATNSLYDALTSGDYRVVVSNSTCSDTSAITAIDIKPLPNVNTTLSGPAAFCSNTSLIISAAGNPDYTYQWQNGGADIAGATSASYTTTAAGSYSVIISLNGCADTSATVTATVLAAPTASATASGPVSFCLPGSVTLSANTGSGLTYAWKRNGLAITPAATGSSYTASVSGGYTVVVSNSNCSATSSIVNVLASTLPSSAVTLVGSTAFCDGSSVQLRAAQVTGYTYQWYRNGAPVTTGGNNFVYVATTAGSYYAVVTNGACNTTTTTTTLTVNPLPVSTATAIGPIAFCEGGSVTLAANTGTGLTYQWRRNGTPLPGETGNLYSAGTSGFYQVVVSNSQCSATSTAVNVNVSTMPDATVSASGPTTFCQSSDVMLTATAGVGYTYQWQRDGLDVPGATGISYTATVSGDYRAKIINGTCVATSQELPISVTPGPDATVSASGALEFCQGNHVELSAPQGVNYTYQWMMNGTPLGGQESRLLNVTNSGSYNVVVNDGVCESTSANTDVAVRQLPVVSIAMISGNVISAPAGYSSYQWFRNGNAISGATGPDYTVTENGFYAVVITDDLGCSSTSSVMQISTLAIANAPSAAAITIYPNPAKDMVQIKSSFPVDVVITTVDGRALINKELATSVDLTHIANGIYLIRISDHKTGSLLKTDKLLKDN